MVLTFSNASLLVLSAILVYEKLCLRNVAISYLCIVITRAFFQLVCLDLLLRFS